MIFPAGLGINLVKVQLSVCEPFKILIKFIANYSAVWFHGICRWCHARYLVHNWDKQDKQDNAIKICYKMGQDLHIQLEYYVHLPYIGF